MKEEIVELSASETEKVRESSIVTFAKVSGGETQTHESVAQSLDEKPKRAKVIRQFRNPA